MFYTVKLMFAETFVGVEAVMVECCTKLPGSASEPLRVSRGPVWLFVH